ncbi:MAG: hypothetical protein PHE51_12840, partial [Eubacteriales bacterium]|nr:hypothetical protein [Eubacteriales bacterium]
LASAGVAEIEQRLAADSQFKVYMWIDKETAADVKYCIDLTAFVNDIMKTTEEATRFDKLVMDIEVTGINTVDKIEIPKEIIDNAVDMSELIAE